MPFKKLNEMYDCLTTFESEGRRQENGTYLSVRTKDGNEYKPTFPRSLVASLERQLKKKGYSNDLVFEKTIEVLKCKQKQPKKQGKGNKPKVPVALTSHELKALFTLDYMYFGIYETQ